MHAFLTFASLPLFLGAALSNWAYAASYQVQWTNFASWLVAAGTLIAALALVAAAIGGIAAGSAGLRPAGLYLGLLVVIVALGIVTSFVHARDAWAAMPAGLVLSIILLLLAAAASVIGSRRRRHGAVA